MAEQGRGAWPTGGRGGTLNAKRNGPGPYYALATKDIHQVGLHGWCLRAQGQPVPLDYNATFHGVVAIQALLNGYAGVNLKGDGIFGPSTDAAVKKMQQMTGLKVDGIVGINTMRQLLLPLIKSKAANRNVSWQAVYGLLRFEGAFDPGAVGVLDPGDIGLAQINLQYHPHVSMSNAFCASFAVDFVAQYLRFSLDNLDDNLHDAVVSYNLGIGGTKIWIDAGRPEEWLPPWSDVIRYPIKYADRILGAYGAGL